MKYGGIKWISGNPFYVHLRKHYCPDCYTQLGTIKIFRVVNSASEEAKNRSQILNTGMDSNNNDCWRICYNINV